MEPVGGADHLDVRCLSGCFLVALLTLGSLSDHVGRRPVLMGALGVQLASNVVFIAAPDVRWVIVGRIMSGLATGAATSAFAGALVELAPPHRKGLGTMLGSVSLTGGLALGSLLAGLTIELSTNANSIIFIILTVATAAGIVVIASCPETVTPARVLSAPRSHTSPSRPRPEASSLRRCPSSPQFGCCRVSPAVSRPAWFAASSCSIAD